MGFAEDAISVGGGWVVEGGNGVDVVERVREDERLACGRRVQSGEVEEGVRDVVPGIAL